MTRKLARDVRIYEVGGAVRDALLGRPVADRDWVVVGATPEMMLASGYRPVGSDFPVFLHPETQEEHALARTERKHGTGYRGFEFFASPDVSLEEDLARRDLTINAMARDEHGVVIDPYHGREDLARGVLRHVSPAFAEDPLRVLRVARFAARFGFRVAPGTRALMRRIVLSGELATLAPERVWRELALGLGEPAPSRMIGVLRDCGALAALLPEVDALFGVADRDVMASRVGRAAARAPGDGQRRHARAARARLCGTAGLRPAGAIRDAGAEPRPRRCGAASGSLPQRRSGSPTRYRRGSRRHSNAVMPATLRRASTATCSTSANCGPRSCSTSSWAATRCAGRSAWNGWCVRRRPTLARRPGRIAIFRRRPPSPLRAARSPAWMPARSRARSRGGVPMVPTAPTTSGARSAARGSPHSPAGSVRSRRPATAGPREIPERATA